MKWTPILVLLAFTCRFSVCFENSETTVISDTSDLTTVVTEIYERSTNHEYFEPESKVLEKDVRKGTKTKRKGPSKKMASKILPLLMIPLMIQGQMISMMLLKLKMMAFKALMVGKLALIIIGLNLLRNAIIGADDIDKQYEQEVAQSHYGYDGSPEYGSWINRRRIFVNDPYPHPYRGYYKNL